MKSERGPKRERDGEREIHFSCFCFVIVSQNGLAFACNICIIFVCWCWVCLNLWDCSTSLRNDSMFCQSTMAPWNSKMGLVVCEMLESFVITTKTTTTNWSNIIESSREKMTKFGKITQFRGHSSTYCVCVHNTRIKPHASHQLTAIEHAHFRNKLWSEDQWLYQ